MRQIRPIAPVTIVALLYTASAAAQSAALTVVDPRPVNALIEQIEKLSGLSINYEDLRYGNPADTEDVTNTVVNPAHQGQIPAGFRVIVPRGGQLLVSIPVDPLTQRLSDSLSTANALNALLAAANSSSVVPGRFAVQAFGNAFIVSPTQSRSSDGSFAPLNPTLSAPVSLPGQTQPAIKTLEAILQQVSSAAGLKVGLGTVPMRALAVTSVTIAASNEPASEVLVRLLSAVASGGVGPGGGTVAISYHAFFDPQRLNYVLNIHVVPNPNSPMGSAPPPTPPTSNATPWGKKPSK
jgi:hypothetical protein